MSSRQEEKGTTEDEMVGWHHRLDGHEFERALLVGEGQGGLACCSPWSHKELDTTEGLNNNNLSHRTLLVCWGFQVKFEERILESMIFSLFFSLSGWVAWKMGRVDVLWGGLIFRMEKEMATHSSILAWKIPWTEEPGRLQSMGSLGVGHNFTFTFHFHALEKEMATHSSILAWRIPGMGEPGGAAVCGVAQSWTRLKWLSSSSSPYFCFSIW